MKSKILLFVLLAAAASCRKEQAVPKTEDPVTVMEYVFTRSEDNPPEDGTAFSFMSYGRNENGTYGPNLNYRDYQPVGTYVYLTDPENKYHGIMQPCEVDADYRYAGVRNPQKGQALTRNRYQTVCVYPAMFPINDGMGGERLLFTREQAVMASDPFEMEVLGYQVFVLPEKLPLRDLRSKVLFDIVQGTNLSFTIENPVLMNPGAWGWCHPLNKSISISYDETEEGKYNIYNQVSNPTDGNTEPLQISEDYDMHKADIYKTGETGKGKIIYSTGYAGEDGMFFFANDYQSGIYHQTGVSFKLMIGDSYFNINIPFDITMKSGMCYRFRLTIEAAVIKVSYRVADWDESHLNGEIGTTPEEIVGIWTPDGWEDHSGTGDPEDIG